MKLMTKEIEKKLPKLYSQDGKDRKEVKIIVKFFCPWNHWTWFVTEGEFDPELDTWVFFGYVKGDFNEFGNFALKELEQIYGPLGLKIERDLHFDNKTLADVVE